MPILTPTRASVAMLGFALVAATGCGPSGEIRTYEVPKEEPKPAAVGGDPDKPATGYRLLGAIIPLAKDPSDREQSRFVKFSGPADKIDPFAKEFDDFLNSLKPKDDPRAPFDFTPPAGAKPGPSKQMRFVTFTFGTDPKPAELYISDPFGGTLLENVNRWRDEVGVPRVTESGLKDVMTEVQLGTAKAYRVDFKGPGGKGGMRGPFQGK